MTEIITTFAPEMELRKIFRNSTQFPNTPTHHFSINNEHRDKSKKRS